MQRFLIGVLLFGTLAFGYSAKYTDAIDAGLESGKDVVVMVTTQYCPYCKRMKKNVIADPEVQTLLGEYVFVELDRDNDEFPDELFSRFVPTVYTLDPKTQKITNERIGYQELRFFVKFLEESKLEKQERTKK